jgi:bacterioferritin
MNRKKSIDLLNHAAADELHAVHQYMYFHFHLDDQGFGPLAMLFKRTAIEEMMHIELLAERILFLKGEVELVAAGEVEKVNDPQGMLLKAAQMEQSSAAFYNKAAAECGSLQDSASKQIFERLVGDEERHFDQYDKQLEHIKQFGEKYLALQSFAGPGDAGGPPATKP